jgi:hypothetical protein
VNGELRNILEQLDNFVVAASFKIFGESTWAGRIPFALAGIVMLPFWWWTLRAEFPEEPVICLYAFAGTALSVNVVLYSRTCRYYALGLLFSVVLLYCYRRFLETPHWRFVFGGTVAASLLCMSSALYCAALLAALAFRHVLFHRTAWDRSAWAKVLCGGAAFAAVAGLYITRTLPPYHFPSRWWVLLSWNLRGLHTINALPGQLAAVLLVVLLALAWLEDRASQRLQAGCRPLLEFTVMTGVYLVVLSLLSPQVVEDTSMADFRYMVPVLPIAALLCAGSLWIIHLRWPALAICLLLIQLNSNLLPVLLGGTKPRWLLPALILEVHRPYPTGTSACVQFLKDMVPRDSVVWVSPNYMFKPLQFYAGDRIKFRGVLENDKAIPRPVGDRLDPQLYVDRCKPDWAILFGAQAVGLPRILYFSGGRTIRPLILGAYGGQSQRPELPVHGFGPPSDVDLRRYGIYLYKIKEGL